MCVAYSTRSSIFDIPLDTSIVTSETLGEASLFAVIPLPLSLPEEKRKREKQGETGKEIERERDRGSLGRRGTGPLRGCVSRSRPEITDSADSAVIVVLVFRERSSAGSKTNICVYVYVERDATDYIV